MNCEELSRIISDNSEQLQVIDLRVEDFEAGHIRGAWHIPVRKCITDEQLETLLKNLQNAFPNELSVAVVFHCTASKNRGPRTKEKFEQYCETLGLGRKFRAVVLTGGFYAWEEYCKKSGTPNVKCQI